MFPDKNVTCPNRTGCRERGNGSQIKGRANVVAGRRIRPLGTMNASIDREKNPPHDRVSLLVAERIRGTVQQCAQAGSNDWQ
jgi:hypothetical protein